MKRLSRLSAFALVLALVLSLAGPAGASGTGKFSDLLPRAADASEAEYSSTQSFLDALNEQELVYEYGGVTDDGDEKVYLSYPGEYCESIRIIAFFGSDEDDVYFRVWNLIDFNSGDTREMLSLVNKLNDSYNFSCFTVDESDYSITVKLDALLPPEGGELALQYLLLLARIADRGYQTLEAYAK